jgi:hypothetical protein
LQAVLFDVVEQGSEAPPVNMHISFCHSKSTSTTLVPLQNHSLLCFLLQLVHFSQSGWFDLQHNVTLPAGSMIHNSGTSVLVFFILSTTAVAQINTDSSRWTLSGGPLDTCSNAGDGGRRTDRSSSCWCLYDLFAKGCMQLTEKPEASPAPFSTMISLKPCFKKVLTDAGVTATRFSPSEDSSLGTPAHKNTL